MNFCDHPEIVVGQMTILLAFKQNLVDPEVNFVDGYFG